VSLEELQDHIEQENRKLEEEGQFWAKEIVVRIEYRACPNLTIIDTPGGRGVGVGGVCVCRGAGLELLLRSGQGWGRGGCKAGPAAAAKEWSRLWPLVDRSASDRAAASDAHTRPPSPPPPRSMP